MAASATIRTGGPAAGPFRLTAVLTHPIQYWSPVFRALAARGDLLLTVVYLTEPAPDQQGAGFDVPFRWDLPLREGYGSRVHRAPLPGDDYDARGGLSAEGLPAAVLATEPDGVLLPGWNSDAYAAVLAACRRRGVPCLYRGDTHLGQAPGFPFRTAWALRTRWMLRRFSAWLSVGARSRLYLRDRGVPAEAILSSPHAVDNDRVARGAAAARASGAAARHRSGAAPGDAVVLFVGKLTETKRPLDLVRAVASLWDPLESTCRHASLSIL